MGSLFEDILKSVASGNGSQGGLGEVLQSVTGGKGGDILGHIVKQATGASSQANSTESGLSEIVKQATGSMKSGGSTDILGSIIKSATQSGSSKGDILGQVVKSVTSGKSGLDLGNIAKSVISVIGMGSSALGAK